MHASTMAAVNRERVLLVGGQRALVMQLAHPLVAAGVADHSDFPARSLERLRRTLDLSLTLIYGTEVEAEAASAGIRAVHERVTGTAAGRPYAATDPDLLLWVNATLVDTTLLVYERFVRPLPERDRRRYYLETVDAAELFGIPRAVIPEDLDAFRAYVRGMLEGPDLRATAEGRRLVADVLRPPLPLPLRVPTAAIRLLTLAMLPERIRSMFGLRAGFGARATLATASRASRLVLPVMPAAVRQFAAARAAGRDVETGVGTMGSMAVFIAPREAFERRDQVQLLDVREPYEWNAGRIDGAVHIPLQRVLEGRTEGLDPERPVVVYCRTANRSEVAKLMLEARGFDASVMEGGSEAWVAEGLPFTTPDGEPGHVA